MLYLSVLEWDLRGYISSRMRCGGVGVVFLWKGQISSIQLRDSSAVSESPLFWYVYGNSSSGWACQVGVSIAVSGNRPVCVNAETSSLTMSSRQLSEKGKERQRGEE